MVVLVLAVLAAIAIPRFAAARTRAQDAVARADLRSAVTTAATARAAGGTWPDATALAAADGALRTTSGPATPGTVAVANPGDTFSAAAQSASGACFRVALDAAGAATWTQDATSPCSATGPLALAYTDQSFATGGSDTITPTISGGLGTGRSFSLASGALPAGVTLNSTSGVITATGLSGFSDGSLDPGFGAGQSGANGTVFAVASLPDGSVIIGGTFSTVNGTARNNIARLNTDGTLDTTFGNGLAGTNGSVSALAVLPDGRVIVGGTFSAVNGTARNNIARLNTDGTLDTTFGNGLAGTNASVMAAVRQPDGAVVIGGGFTTVNGTARGYIARLNTDGTLDATFGNGLTGANNWVRGIALQSDTKAVIAGSFTSVNGTTRGNIARLNTDGTLDATFGNGLAGTSHWTHPVAVQADGKILIGGQFMTVNGTGRNRLARLNTDGTLDTTFLNGLSGPDANPQAFAVRPDGRIVMGGWFSSVNGTTRGSVARLGGLVVPGFPATVTVQVAESGGGTASANLTLTIA